MTQLALWPRVTSLTPATTAFVIDQAADTSPVTKSILGSNVMKSFFASVTDPVLFKSADGINFDTADGGDSDIDILTLDVTGTPKLWWDESVDAFGLSKPLYIGGTQTTNSIDPMVNVNRTVDGAGTDNAHCFSDSSVISRTGGGVSYNSFDARIDVTGAGDFNHFASFQGGPAFAGSGTIGIAYGFVDAPAISSGTITNRYGVYITDVAKSGTGAVTNNYGLFVPALAAGATINYAVRTTSPTLSYFGGNISVGAVPSLLHSIYVGGAHAQTTHYGIMNEASNAGSMVGFNAKATTTGSGNLSLVMGYYSQMVHDSSGTLLNLYGLYVGNVNNGGGCADAYGVRIVDCSGTGTITNQYGVHVAQLAKGGTLNYAIYTAGATPSLFTGAVTVGGLVMADATDIVLNTTTGTKIGTATNQKLGFFNVTPIVQPTVATDATVGTLITSLTLLGLIKNA